jgi:hypothetical protein
MASRAICSMVSGVVPAEPPTPALSNVTTRRARASAPPVNWHQHQRVVPADPSSPWESLVRILVGLPALMFRHGRERPGQMSRFKPLTG